MAKRLKLSLTPAQVRMLLDAAEYHVATDDEPLRMRWGAICREARRALAHEAERNLEGT